MVFIPAGTILRVTKAVEGSFYNRNLIGRRKYAWAVVSDDTRSDDEIYVEWFQPATDKEPGLDFCPYLFRGSGDEWDVPHEEDVPGKVWAALAKYRLENS